MAWWVWIILGALLLAVEVVVTANFYLVFFGIAALVLGLAGVFGVTLPAWVQFLLFATLAVAGLALYRGRMKRRLQTADRQMGPELVGEAGTARDAIAPGARGRVELRGSTWDARNDGTVVIATGARCIVLGVEGLTLLLRASD